MKDKKISVATVIVLIALSVLITFQLTYLRVNNKYQKALNEIRDTQLLYDKLAAIDTLYRDSFIGEIDETKLIDYMLKGYVYGTGDKYGAYFTKDEFTEILKDSSAELVGIGVSVLYDSDMQAIRIANVMPASPALEAGLNPGDFIISVEDSLVSELGYSAAMGMLRGEEGTKARFTAISGSTVKEYEIERRKITEYTVFERVYSKDSSIGIVRILEFDNGTPVQFKAAVDGLLEKGVNKIIFDVRNNPGGHLDSIHEILDYLLPEGIIIRTYDADGKEETLTSDASSIDCKMAVIVNGNTASAAELFAAALRDYDKAFLVGEKTYGKGTVQTIRQLYDGSAISVSDRIYAPPVSENYEGKGLEPDIRAEQNAEYKNASVFLLNDENDAQLAAALREITK